MSTDATIYMEGPLRAVLTTDRFPVLRVLDGTTVRAEYRPADLLPGGVTAGRFVRMFLAGREAWPGAWGPDTPAARALAERFVGAAVRR